MSFAYLIEPPINGRTAADYLIGCDIDLARYVFDQLGMTDIRFVEATLAELLPGLAEGRWQMTTGLFVTNA